MKRILTAIAVLTASLALAPTALAHPNVTGSATQYCDGQKVKLSASFSNAGFDEGTTVTATDSGGAALIPPSGGSPYVGTATFNVSDRAAGTVTFAWTATDGDSGTVLADYPAVSGCIPPPTTTTTTPPPPPPSNHHTGGPPHISTAPHGHSPKGSRPPAAKGPPAGVSSGDTLPFSGLPLAAMAGAGLGLLLGGTLLVGLLAQQRYNEARRRRRPN